MIGIHCPVDLMSYSQWEPPPIVTLKSSVDDDGMEQGERINGYCECPKCGLWWPCVEEPDMWEEIEPGKWGATGWWGAAVCGECNLLMADQPDGTSECYQL